MKKILIAVFLPLMVLLYGEEEEKDTTAWFDVSRSCFQCSLQPYRPYCRMFPSDVPVKGLNFSYYSAQKKISGLSMALIDCSTVMKGITLELFNHAETMRGISLAGVAWNGALYGFSFAIVNIAEKSGRTLQFGLYNHARNGWQFGLLNYNRNGRVRLMPFINHSEEEREP